MPTLVSVRPRHVTAVLLACLLPVLASSCASTAPKARPGGAAAAAGAGSPDKPYQDWKKVTKDAEVKKGFFTLYQKRENLYLEIRPDQLDTPVLGVFSLARGIGQNFVLGGLPVNDRLMEFHRSGDRILVMEMNHRFQAPAGRAIEQARDLSHGNSVIASLKIESVHDSSKAILVDIAPFIVSDITDMSEQMRFAFGNRAMRFEKERSALTSVKAFPENVEIEALLTYAPNDRYNWGLDAVPDNRYIPVTMHYSFSKLPDKPMAPRFADDRVGYFVNAKKDFGRDSLEHFWVRYVERWRLEKQDPNATLSEPVKPIVFYIDHTVPTQYRPYVKEGIERWQKAFEKAGFKNAILAKDPPDDPEWDAEDVRYSTIRWITSNEPSFSAIGPSRTDPRTGEILDADILIEGTMMVNYRNTWRRSIGPRGMEHAVTPRLELLDAYGPDVLKPSQERNGRFGLDRLCMAASGLSDQMGELHTSLLLDGAIAPGGPIPEEFIRGVIVVTVLHEVGHSLGLRHNFRSSTSVPFDKLHDSAWTDAHGVTGSVMDYEGINVSLNGAPQGQYFGTTVGPYDEWAIRYGYTPSGAADVDADYAFVRGIASESLEPGHEYSTDEDTYPAEALDPRTNIWDLGTEPLEYARQHTAYLAKLWKNPNFEEKILGADGTYPTLRRAVDNLLMQYARSLGMAVKYVGGQEQSRAHRGQTEGAIGFRPLPASKQREALDFIARRAFSAQAFDVPKPLMNRLSQDQWLHWGVQNGFQAAPFRLDYDFNEKVFATQNALLNGLTNPSLLARVREAEGRNGDPYRLAEHFSRLTTALWSEVDGGTAGLKSLDGPHTRRQLQRAYVDRLATFVTTPPAGTPDDARALARVQLAEIDRRAARALASGAAMSDDVRAHLSETRARVRRAVDAGRSADPAGPRARAEAQ